MRLGSWTVAEKKMLMDIAVNNSQIFYILNDKDVSGFYKKILDLLDKIEGNAEKVQHQMEKKRK